MAAILFIVAINAFKNMYFLLCCLQLVGSTDLMQVRNPDINKRKPGNASIKLNSITTAFWKHIWNLAINYFNIQKPVHLTLHQNFIFTNMVHTPNTKTHGSPDTHFGFLWNLEQPTIHICNINLLFMTTFFLVSAIVDWNFHEMK